MSQREFCCALCQSVLPVFSSQSFIVSGLTFKSLIHFECIFVYGVRKCSNFILLHVAVQFSQHHLLKRPSFFHCTVIWILLFPIQGYGVSFLLKSSLPGCRPHPNSFFSLLSYAVMWRFSCPSQSLRSSFSIQ